MQGTNVIVIRPVGDSYDSHGNAIKTDVLETVNDVLVNRSATTDLNDRAAHNEAIETKLRLAFPKTYQEPLRDCRVIIPLLSPTTEWQVIGDPSPIPHNCPTRWNYAVEVKLSDG